MIFFHGTSEQAWDAIQAEGVLWGLHSYRHTYLTPEIEVARKYGSVILEVEYTPRGVGIRDAQGQAFDNYGFDPPSGQTCWQFSVFKPIPVADVRKLSEKTLSRIPGGSR